MIALGLRQVQPALNYKADPVQKQFIEASAAVDDIGRRLLEPQTEERRKCGEQEERLGPDSEELAELVNHRRDRARAVLSQSGETKLRAYLNERWSCRMTC